LFHLLEFVLGSSHAGAAVNIETVERGAEAVLVVTTSPQDELSRQNPQNSCPGQNAGCSLSLGETQEQRQTQVASHEFAEMVTDPELNAWLDAKAGENGDICNGESATITVGANTWTVQRTYSTADDIASQGESLCLATAPAPILALKPGP